MVDAEAGCGGTSQARLITVTSRSSARQPFTSSMSCCSMPPIAPISLATNVMA